MLVAEVVFGAAENHLTRDEHPSRSFAVGNRGVTPETTRGGGANTSLSTGGTLYKRRREEAENGVVLHGGLYGPPYELPVGQNVGHGFSGKVISIIH